MAFKQLDMATVEASLRSALVLGVEKSGKTTFIGTAPKPILHYCFDMTSWERLAGTAGITSILVDGPAQVSEFDRDLTSLAITPRKYKWPDGREEGYKTIGFDPYSFHSDAILEDESKRTADGFKVYGNILTSHRQFLSVVKQLTKSYNIIVTCHVEIKQDDTTGQKMFLADLNGKIRNSIGAHFDAVLFTKVVLRGSRVEYKICPIPDNARKAGVRVPMGCEDMFGELEELNFTKLQEKYTAGLQKVRQANQPVPGVPTTQGGK